MNNLQNSDITWLDCVRVGRGLKLCRLVVIGSVTQECLYYFHSLSTMTFVARAVVVSVSFKCTLIFTFFINVESFKYVGVPFIVAHQLSIASSLFQFVWPFWYICMLSLLWFGLILERYFFFNTGFLTRKRQPPCGYVACSSLMTCTELRVRILSYSCTCTKKTCYNKECGVEHNLNLSFTLPFATLLLY